MKIKRLTLLCGHYGSGKTNIAVNLALFMKQSFPAVKIADLDIVNPYYRTIDSRKELESQGIRVIRSDYAGGNLDFPALPQEMYALTDDRSVPAVLDIGGDDRGALVLGRLAPAILEENDYEMLAVINRFRPLTPDAASTVEVLKEIEMAGKIPFTGLVNNSNLGRETTEETVLSSLEYAEEVADRTGLPVVLSTVRADLFGPLKEKIPNPFPLWLQHQIWQPDDEQYMLRSDGRHGKIDI